MEITSHESLKRLFTIFLLILLPLLLILYGVIIGIVYALFYILIIFWFGMGVVFFNAIQ